MSTPASPLPRIAVVYNIGSAGPTQIGPAAEGLCEVVFVVDKAVDIVRARMAEIATFGSVCDVTGLDLVGQANALKVRQFDAITTFSDSEVLRTAELAQMLGLRYHSPDTARWIRDKTAQRQRLRESDVEDTVSVSVCSAVEVAEAVGEVGLPAVLKPRQGTAGRNTFRLHTRDDVTHAVTGIDLSSGYTVETMLRGEPSVAGPQWGDYVSVESSVIDGVAQHLLVCGKTPLTYPFRETGQFFPATLDAEAHAAVLDLTTRALRALGVTHGSTHTEIKLTADGPRIIEVNGRLGGHLYWMFSDGQTGWDVARVTLQTAVGLPPDPMPDTSEVTYLLRAQPPVDAVSLVGLPGLDAVRALPGVRRVDVRGRPGKDVRWRNGTSTQVALVYGAVPDHAALLPVIEAFHAELAASYQYA